MDYHFNIFIDVSRSMWSFQYKSGTGLCYNYYEQRRNYICSVINLTRSV